MYARDLQGETLTFGVSGKLIMNGLVMYDRETGSLWSQVLGQGVEGVHKNTPLPVIAALQTTWQLWLAEHPGTLVLDKGGRYRTDSYASYYAGSSQGIHGGARGDLRLNPKELVLGVVLSGSTKAFPFQALDRTPVVNDSINGIPLLATFDPASRTAAAFDPVVDGVALQFRQVSAANGPRMSDLETGTLWDPITGRALEGTLAGRTLRRLPSHYEFWFSWSAFRPDTLLYAPPSN